MQTITHASNGRTAIHNRPPLPLRKINKSRASPPLDSTQVMLSKTGKKNKQAKRTLLLLRAPRQPRSPCPPRACGSGSSESGCCLACSGTPRFAGIYSVCCWRSRCCSPQNAGNSELARSTSGVSTCERRRVRYAVRYDFVGTAGGGVSVFVRVMPPRCLLNDRLRLLLCETICRIVYSPDSATYEIYYCNCCTVE